jgi:hypothetical protein
LANIFTAFVLYSNDATWFKLIHPQARQNPGP